MEPSVMDLMQSKLVKIIDVSQPVSSKSACFPGDTPFSRKVTLTYQDSQVINLTALTMSPHVGTHADSPVHVRGDMSQSDEMAGQMPLEPFVGQALVLDIAPFTGEIKVDDVSAMIPETVPERVLFRTCHQIRYDVFEQSYSYFSIGLVDYLWERGVRLMGIDTPSVDATTSKSLEAHHQLLQRDMYWLENLDLTHVRAGTYILVALPLKLMELEASPVRAVLMQFSEEREK